MKINNLKIFIKLVETGSYSLVAEQMNLTQPAVSMQIKTIEEKFSADLVFKEKNKIKLTPSGKIFYNQAKNILNEWEQLLFDIEEVRDKTFGKINIGTSTIPSEYLLPKYLSEYSRRLPEVQVLVEVGDSARMIELLEKRNVDLIIVGTEPQNSKYKTLAITEDHLQLIVPTQHHLTETNEVSINTLKKEKMIIREKGSGTRKAMLDGLKEYGDVELNELCINCRLGSTESVISAVESGMGISFVSSLAAKKAKKFNRISIVKVSDMLINRKFYMAYNEKRENELLIKKFTNLFKNI